MNIIPLMFYPRSGSTVIDHILTQHPLVNAINEPHREHRESSTNQRLKINRQKPKKVSLKDFMKPVIGALPKNKKIVCFQYCDLDIGYISEIYDIDIHANFIKNNFKNLIIIRRKNILKQIISYYKAHYSNIWHNNNNQSTEFKFKFTFDECIMNNTLNEGNSFNYFHNPILPRGNNISSIYEYIDVYEKDQKNLLLKLQEYNVNYLDIIYEDHIENNPFVAIKMIENYIKIPHYDNYTMPLKKISKGIEYDITNYDEICKELQNTKYEWMLG